MVHFGQIASKTDFGQMRFFVRQVMPIHKSHIILGVVVVITHTPHCAAEPHNPHPTLFLHFKKVKINVKKHTLFRDDISFPKMKILLCYIYHGFFKVRKKCGVW